MHLSNFTVIVGGMIVFSWCAFAFAEETILPGPPEEEIVRITPIKPDKTPNVLADGTVVVSSVASYTIAEKSVSACSFIARNNIVQLLEAMNVSPDMIARGDANELIRFGRASNTLTSFTIKEDLLMALEVRHEAYMETVFDVYRFVARRSERLQGHRVVVFRGDDHEWYILDPLDGQKTTEPQLFREFLSNDVEAEWLVRFPGYSRVNLITESEFRQALPYLSSELRTFFESYQDIPLLAFHSVASGYSS